MAPDSLQSIMRHMRHMRHRANTLCRAQSALLINQNECRVTSSVHVTRSLQGHMEPRGAGKPGALAVLLRLAETHLGAWIHAALDVLLQRPTATSTDVPAGTSHRAPDTGQSPPADVPCCGGELATPPDARQRPGCPDSVSAAQETESQRLARDACCQAVRMLEGMVLPAMPMVQVEQVAKRDKPAIARCSHPSAQLQDGKVAEALDPQVAQNTAPGASGNGMAFTQSQGSIERSETSRSEAEAGSVDGGMSCLIDASSVHSCEARVFLPSHDQTSAC